MAEFYAHSANEDNICHGLVVTTFEMGYYEIR